MQNQGVDEQDISKMKIAMTEVLKDTGAVGKPQEDQQVTASKMGVVSALKDLAG